MVRRALAGVVAAFCGWVAYAIYGEAATSHAIDSRVSAVRAQNDALRTQIADRQREISQAQSSAWLEEEARKLGYVKPGEKVFVLTTPGASLPPGGGVDVKSLPSFSADASPSSSAAAAAPSPSASPTPYVLSLPAH